MSPLWVAFEVNKLSFILDTYRKDINHLLDIQGRREMTQDGGRPGRPQIRLK